MTDKNYERTNGTNDQRYENKRRLNYEWTNEKERPKVRKGQRNERPKFRKDQRNERMQRLALSASLAYCTFRSTVYGTKYGDVRGRREKTRLMPYHTPGIETFDTIRGHKVVIRTHYGLSKPMYSPIFTHDIWF